MPFILQRPPSPSLKKKKAALIIFLSALEFISELHLQHIHTIYHAGG